MAVVLGALGLFWVLMIIAFNFYLWIRPQKWRVPTSEAKVTWHMIMTCVGGVLLFVTFFVLGVMVSIAKLKGLA